MRVTSSIFLLLTRRQKRIRAHGRPPLEPIFTEKGSGINRQFVYFEDVRRFDETSRHGLFSDSEGACTDYTHTTNFMVGNAYYGRTAKK